MKKPALFAYVSSIPMIWKLWWLLLLCVNGVGGIIFSDTDAGQSAVLSLVGILIIMVIIYVRLGIVRLLSLGRILFWFPMEIEFAVDIIDGNSHGQLYIWQLVLIVLNGLMLCKDFVDIFHFSRGDTKPVQLKSLESSENDNNPF